MRSPTFVAFANFFLPGLGYVLLGKRLRFGWTILLACVLQIIQLVIDPISSFSPYYVVYGSSAFSVTLGVLALGIGLTAFGYDAYTLAKSDPREI